MLTGGYGSIIDGAIGNSRFHSPFQMDMDNHNNIYVADSYNHAIRFISTNLSYASTLAGG